MMTSGETNILTSDVAPIPRRLNGIEVEVVTFGEPGRPLLILLHGFPDVWTVWRFQIGEIAARGFRVLVPNQRGYGKSEKPRPVAAYDIDTLAQDVTLLAQSEGYVTFDVVGHDWGGMVAWRLAMLFPERVRNLIVLNAPHPGIFREFVLTHPRQMLRSWYGGFFQLPKVPEMLMKAAQFRFLKMMTQHAGREIVFDETDHRLQRQAWSEPGALTAMTNYYRAIARRSSSSLRLRVVVPTLILFGRQDPTMEPGLADLSSSLCDSVQIIWFPDSKHWIQLEEPDRVNAAILNFLASADRDDVPQQG